MAIQDIVLIYSDGTAHVMRAWQWHQDPTLATLKELHIWYVWLPGEAIWLSLPMFFVNDILIAAWISSLAFSLATMVVVYGIAKEVYGSKNARISVIIVAILPQAVWYSTGAVMDTFSNFFMLLAVWGILLGYKRNPIYFLVSGVALALGNLTRYESWIFTGVITLVLIYIILRSHNPNV